MMKILIVDDNQSVLNQVQGLLTEHGFDSVTASNGLDGLEKAQVTHFDLFIIDHLMPIMNGLQLAKNLRQNLATTRTPILFMSTQDLSLIEKTTELKLLDALASKPLAEKTFISQIYSLLEQNSQQQSL